jgi:hypothetical protein
MLAFHQHIPGGATSNMAQCISMSPLWGLLLIRFTNRDFRPWLHDLAPPGPITLA